MAIRGIFSSAWLSPSGHFTRGLKYSRQSARIALGDREAVPAIAPAPATAATIRHRSWLVNLVDRQRDLKRYPELGCSAGSAATLD
jgi:hypothetical protein